MPYLCNEKTVPDDRPGMGVLSEYRHPTASLLPTNCLATTDHRVHSHFITYVGTPFRLILVFIFRSLLSPDEKRNFVTTHQRDGG
jgi:hypothetical protein